MKTQVAIKICGVTRPEDVPYGVDFVGVIYYPPSKRHVTAVQANVIAQTARNRGVEPVAVFVDASQKEMEQFLSLTGITHVQLHGHKAARNLPRGNYTILALHEAGANAPVAQGDYLLVDQPKGMYPFQDFTSPASNKWILAGGLTPENVRSKIALYCPYGVDVCSGVEQRPGIKSHEKIEAFVRAVRS